ncbi:MAG: histidine kinase [Bacteroidota bacterium]|nr:histidine kinase [Bacteroidota bacterium]
MQIESNVSSILVLVFSLTLLIMGVFFTVLIIIYFKKINLKQKESLNNILIGQENERERLSRDLHDELGPTLSTIIFTVDAIKTDNEENNKNKELAKNQLKESIAKVRQISHNLTSLSLKKYGLVNAISELIDSNKNGNQTFVFTTNCQNSKFIKENEIHLYKIIQELIINTQKHSEANKIIIDLQNYNNKFYFEYSDDGNGFKERSILNEGIGMKNIYTRVGLINAKIQVIGEKGFNLKIEF